MTRMQKKKRQAKEKEEAIVHCQFFTGKKLTKSYRNPSKWTLNRVHAKHNLNRPEDQAFNPEIPGLQKVSEEVF